MNCHIPLVGFGRDSSLTAPEDTSIKSARKRRHGCDNPVIMGEAGCSGTTGPNVNNPYHVFAASILAKPMNFSTKPAPKQQVARTSQPNGRKLHNLLREGPLIWEFDSYEWMNTYIENSSEDTLISLLVRSGLLCSFRMCAKCDRPMQLRSRLSTHDNIPTVEWRCRGRRNGKKFDCSAQSCRNGSYFTFSKLNLHKQVEMMFNWLGQFENTSAAGSLSSSLSEQKGELRTLLSRHIMLESPIGGPQTFVDISVKSLKGGTGQLILLCERKADGRAAAMTVANGSTGLAALRAFLSQSLLPSSTLVFEEAQSDLHQLFASHWPMLPVSSFQCTELRFSSNVVESKSCFDKLLLYLAPQSKAPELCVDQQLLNEAVLRFNHRDSPRRFFWSLLSVERGWSDNSGSVAITRKMDKEASDATDGSLRLAGLDGLLALHGLRG